ncbi:hypothetical protein OF376_02710 [Ureaplasma miroungigenitalium]|uniref:Multiple banded antigen n=1 Tax=Ureaplasma miroungigenitalium TaxID=1042321 RepID=A0ABT3BN55_9BACT|nr:hypothetical protein [Ureaplasma miroungigenitalium]MCV3728674.1 hypothetical protein [Ureaplasma miroungigenitalium]MCV3734365.1 hypothetical protein [Ureaplasma miroungigenitalium]
MSKLSNKAKIILIVGVIASLGIGFAVYGISRAQSNRNAEQQEDKQTVPNDQAEVPKETGDTEK